MPVPGEDYARYRASWLALRAKAREAKRRGRKGDREVAIISARRIDTKLMQPLAARMHLWAREGSQ